MIKVRNHVIYSLISMTILMNGSLEATQKSIVKTVLNAFHKHSGLKKHIPKELISLICKYAQCRLCDVHKQIKPCLLIKEKGMIKDVLCYKQYQYLIVLKNNRMPTRLLLYNGENNRIQAIEIGLFHNKLRYNYSMAIYPCKPEPLLIFVKPNTVYSLSINKNKLKIQQSITVDTATKDEYSNFATSKKPIFSSVYNGVILFNKECQMLVWRKNNDKNIQGYFVKCLKPISLTTPYKVSSTPYLQSISENKEKLYFLGPRHATYLNYNDPVSIKYIDMEKKNVRTFFRGGDEVNITNLAISTNKVRPRLAVIQMPIKSNMRYTKNRKVRTLCRWDISNLKERKALPPISIDRTMQVMCTRCNAFILVQEKRIVRADKMILHSLEDNEAYKAVVCNNFNKMGLCALLVSIYHKINNTSSLYTL